MDDGYYECTVCPIPSLWFFFCNSIFSLWVTTHTLWERMIRGRFTILDTVSERGLTAKNNIPCHLNCL